MASRLDEAQKVWNQVNNKKKKSRLQEAEELWNDVNNVQPQTKITPEFLQSQQDKLLGVNYVKNTVQQIPNRLQKSLGGIIQSFEEIPNPEFERVIKEQNLEPINPQFQNVGKGLVEDATRQINLVKQQNQVKPGSVGDIVSEAVGSVIETAPTLAASIVTKNPAPLLTQAGLSSWGQTYAAGREMGATPEQSRLSAAGSIVADVGANLLPAGRLLKPGATLGKKLITQVAEQGLANAGAEAFKTAVDTATVNPNMTLQEGLGRIGTAGLTGGIMGGLMGAAVDPFIQKPNLVKTAPKKGLVMRENPAVIDNKIIEQPYAGPDRRINTELRKVMDKMTPEEIQDAVYRQKLTGMYNKTVYQKVSDPQSPLRKPVQVAVDGDGIKWINDNYGHEAGDQLLKNIGESFKSLGYEDVFHLSGDEFAAQFNTEAEAHGAMKKVAENLKNGIIKVKNPDGSERIIRGGEFTYAIGPDYTTADVQLKGLKEQKKLAKLEQAQREGISDTRRIQPDWISSEAIGQRGDTTGGENILRVPESQVINKPSQNEAVSGFSQTKTPINNADMGANSNQLGIVFKPKAPFIKTVEPRQKTMAVNPINTQLESIAPTQNRIVDYAQTKTPLKKLPSILYQKLIDNQHFIKKFTGETGPKTASIDPYKMASNSRSAPGTVNYILAEGLVNKQGERIGNSFKQIIDQVPKQYERQFNDYLLHRHNIDRMGFVDKAQNQVNQFEMDNPALAGMDVKKVKELAKQKGDEGTAAREYLDLIDAANNAKNKPIFGEETTSDMSRRKTTEYEKIFPDFKRLAGDYDQFMKKFMGEWGEKSGLITPELWAHLQELYPNYTPTYRAQEITIGEPNFNTKRQYGNQPSPIKKATGGSKPVLNPLETTMRLVDKTVKAAKYNEVGQTIVKAVREDPAGLKQWAEIVEDADAPDITKTATSEGIEGVMDEFVDQYDKPKVKLNQKNIVRVMENGKPVYLKINDKDFLESVTGLINYNPGVAEKIARKVTGPYKALITGKNPIFAVRNIARDIPAAYINGSIKNPFKFYQNLAVAAKEMVSNNKMFQEYKAIGGGQSGFFKEGGLKNLYKQEGVISQFNESIESLPRYAEYRHHVLKGKNTYDAKMEGLFYANEITTNFARHGNLAKSLDAFVPYLNPSIQGLDRLIRQVKNNPLATVGKGVAIITIPQVAFSLMNQNNPNYQELDKRNKDIYYLIPNIVGEKDEKGFPKTFIKIPKAREYGVAFADVFDRIYRGIRGEKNSFDGFLWQKGQGLKGVMDSTVATQFSPTNPLESNILSTIVTNLPSNKDFAGRTIVPLSLQRLSPRYQYDETTSEISKAIGDKLNISPKQADYLIKSYTGVIGQFLLPMTTKTAGKLNAGTMGTNTLTRNFIADPLFSNEIMNEFYSKKEKLDTSRADAKMLGKTFSDKNIELQRAFNRGADQISEYNKKIKKAATEEEKRKLRAEMLRVAKQYNAMIK